MAREYIKITIPSPLPNYIPHLKELDDSLWKKWVFYHLLKFYQNYDSVELKQKVEREREKSFPRVEREIAKFLRIKLNDDETFGYHFTAIGENTNDEEVEGNYDVTIHSTNWKSKNFHFECKNLNGSQDLVNKYVCYNTYKKTSINDDIYDGGVLRYFNLKYAQNSSFGGMIGFILEGNILDAKNKIIAKLNQNLTTSPEGDLLRILDSSIFLNDFTFDSYHNRFNSEFIIHHLLFDLKV